MAHEKNYHSTKVELLALKWAVTEHFKEYLPYQPFLVKTDNNPLTYIMTTPNLDATGHWWVGALARFNFQLEYQKGCDNTMADVLSQITTYLNPDAVRSIVDRITLGAAHWAEIQDPAVVEGDHNLEQEVHVAAGCTCWSKCMWLIGQELRGKIPVLSAVLNWLEAHKKTESKNALLAEHASSEEGQLILLELTELLDSSESPIPVLHMPKGREWRSSALHSPKSA